MTISSGISIKASRLGQPVRWLLVIACLTTLGGAAFADPIKPRKLPRPTSREHNWIPSLCAHEHFEKQMHAIESLTDKEVATLEQQAEKGDIEAIRVLSWRWPKDGSRGLDYSYAAAWKRRAQAAGDVVALFEKARSARTLQIMNDRSPFPPEHPERLGYTSIVVEQNALDMQDGRLVAPSLEEVVSLAERVVQERESADVALWLGMAYGSPHSPPAGFDGIQGDPNKALKYLRFAAERGNLGAAEKLCAANYNGNSLIGIVGPNYGEARRWCAIAAQAECARDAPFYLGRILERGVGGPRDLLGAITWRSIEEHRKAVPDPRY